MNITNDTEIGKIKEMIEISLPINDFGLKKLLRTIPVEFSDRNQSACISDNPLLITFNKDFVIKHANNSNKLAFLFMHECFHYLFGHLIESFFIQNEYLGDIRNLVTDVYINSNLNKLFNGFSGIKLLTDFYDKETFPQYFLRPKSKPMFTKISHYKKIWGNKEDVGLYKIYLILKNEKIDNSTIFIGNHEDTRDNKLSKECLNVLENILNNNEKSGLFEDLKAQIISVINYENEKMKKKLIGWIPNKNIYKLDKFAKNFVNVKTRTVIPSKHDKKIGLLAIGYTPIFWNSKKSVSFTSKITAFIDVSGSVNEYKSTILGFIKKYGDLLNNDIYQFSTKIAEINRERLMSIKEFETTFGTSDCCIEKIIELCEKKRDKDFVIFTDSFFDIKKELIKKFKGLQINLYVFLFDNCTKQAYKKMDLFKISKDMIILEK